MPLQVHAHVLTGEACRARRDALDLSRNELARRALVDAATIYRLETAAPVASLTRRRIAAALDQAEAEAS